MLAVSTAVVEPALEDTLETEDVVVNGGEVQEAETWGGRDGQDR